MVMMRSRVNAGGLVQFENARTGKNPQDQLPYLEKKELHWQSEA